MSRKIVTNAASQSRCRAFPGRHSSIRRTGNAGRSGTACQGLVPAPSKGPPVINRNSLIFKRRTRIGPAAIVKHQGQPPDLARLQEPIKRQMSRASTRLKTIPTSSLAIEGEASWPRMLPGCLLEQLSDFLVRSLGKILVPEPDCLEQLGCGGAHNIVHFPADLFRSTAPRSARRPRCAWVPAGAGR
jgi:hypothetical protein